VFGEAGMQVSPVAMSCPSPWLHPVCCYKRPLKEEEGLLPFGALLWAFGLFAWLLALVSFLPLNIGKKLFGFCFLGIYFGPFSVGSFWKGKELLKGKISEGKRIVEGKMLKRG
jgi:hypothetical protein